MVDAQDAVGALNFGDYHPGTMLICICARTAVRKEITSFGTFLHTLCHEFCLRVGFHPVDSRIRDLPLDSQESALFSTILLAIPLDAAALGASPGRSLAERLRENE